MPTALGPSRRVRLLQAIALKTSAEEASTAMLTLRSFGLETGYGPEDKYEYVISVCERATDEVLLGLAEHYGLVPAEVALSPDLWQPGMVRLFISHLSAEKTFASEIRDEATVFGISGFVAHEDIAPSAEWLRTIEEALQTCDAFALVLTKGFQSSVWTDQETGFALSRRVVIAPVRVDLLPYGFVSRYQAVDGRARDSKKIAEALLDLLLTDPRTSEETARALISAFEKSRLWSEAIATSKAIESRPEILTTDFKRRLRAAVTDNPQIASAYYVPERIARITADLGS